MFLVELACLRVCILGPRSEIEHAYMYSKLASSTSDSSNWRISSNREPDGEIAPPASRRAARPHPGPAARAGLLWPR